MKNNEVTMEAATAQGVLADGSVGTQQQAFPQIQKLETGKALTPYVEINRAILLQAVNFEQDLYTAITKRGKGKQAVTIAPSGNSDNVNMYWFPRVLLAIGKFYYNDSSKYGTIETRGGVTYFYGMEKMFSETGACVGRVLVSFADFLKEVTGQTNPSTKHKQEITNLLTFLHSTYINVKGYAEVSPLAIITYPKYKKRGDKLIRDENGKVYVHIMPHPCWAECIKGRGRFDQDANKRLKGLSRLAVTLHNRLAAQDKRKAYVRTINKFVDDMGISPQYKHDKKRTENNIRGALQDLKERKFLFSYGIDYIEKGDKKRIRKISILLQEPKPKETQKNE